MSDSKYKQLTPNTFIITNDLSQWDCVSHFAWCIHFYTSILVTLCFLLINTNA